MIDLSRLTPAPWEPDFDDGSIEGVLQMIHHGNVNTITRTGEQFSHADLKFIAMARNAYDVIMRRGWTPRNVGFESKHFAENKWTAGNLWCATSNRYYAGPWKCPFEALVEADKWMTERGL